MNMHIDSKSILNPYNVSVFSAKCNTNGEATDSKFQNMKNGLPHDKASPFFDRLVFDKVSPPNNPSYFKKT